jgi:broad specificity phosphatase PhoE
MLIAVRHGSTSFNGEGEKLRGWLDLPLSSRGEKEACCSADKLKDILKNTDINNFHSSDLLRARQTAAEIKARINKDYKITSKLRDWNIGEFSGKLVEDNIKKLHYFLDNPDETVNKGESYNDFYDRVLPFLTKLVESNNTNLAVTHNRLTTLLQALSKNDGESPDLKILKSKGPIDPGGILAVYPDWSTQVIMR